MSNPENRIVTCIAPVNIAVIKYWGKKDETLLIPINDSLSGTLSTDEMHAKTTIMASSSFKSDRMWLNGKEETFSNPRLQNCLREIRLRAQAQSKLLCPLSWHIHVCSENNFPTAAGLASSAAGYACLVFTLGKLYGVSGDLSALARQGSGSACRSLDGGFVRWYMGSAPDGKDSIAKQVVPASHWPEMRVLILVVNDTKKKVSSTSGMQRSVETSDLIKHRATHVVPQRIREIEQAIHKKDFAKFAEITMKDSNQFHAVALDTYPPAVYMNDISHMIADLIHRYNDLRGCKVAYTYDAGPNACLYLLEPVVAEIVAIVNYFFPPPQASGQYLKGAPVPTTKVNTDVIAQMQASGVQKQNPGLLKYIIHTKIGEGPQQLTDSNAHLLNPAGLPKSL